MLARQEARPLDRNADKYRHWFSKLLEAANRVCEADRREPGLVVLRRLSVA